MYWMYVPMHSPFFVLISKHYILLPICCSSKVSYNILALFQEFYSYQNTYKGTHSVGNQIQYISTTS